MDTGPLDYLYLVALIASVVVTTVSATRTLLGSKVKGLHKSLSRDTELLPTLTEEARSELAQDLEVRSYRMLAAIKYPFMRTHDVLALALAAACVLALYALAIELESMEVMGVFPDPVVGGAGQFITASVGVVIFARVWKSVMDRAADHIEYLYARVGDEEADQRTQLLAFQVFGGAGLFALPLGGLMLWNLRILAEIHGWGGWASFGAIPILLVLAVVAGVTMTHRFAEITSFYGGVFSEGVHPRLRPEGLGQTQEDLDRFREALGLNGEPTTKPAKKRWWKRASKGD